jgi:ATP-dependent RNA helicase DeaD
VDELAAYYDPSLVAAAALSLLLDEQPAEEAKPEIPVNADGAERGMTRLFINIGSKDGLRPSDVVGAIANEARIPGKAIGVIEIKDTYSFAEIPENLVGRVVDALQGGRIRNRPVRVEVAPSRPHGDGRLDKRPVGDTRERERDRDRRERPRPRG